eukprot:Lithocolla_globosa_v1_NODE_99_length_6376_cov_39.997943.p5 type:complete len:109 gc:universal NODE_99_length_6376_cov_39.997943:2821-3147(+)
MLYLLKSDCTSLLKNSFPSSVCNFNGVRLEVVNIFSNADATVFASLFFKGTAHACLLNISITVSKYLNPSLSFTKRKRSAKSAAHCSSIPLTITLRLSIFLLTGLCKV